MNKRALLINIAIMFWVIAAEVLVINASSKAQNQPLSFDVVEAVSTLAFFSSAFAIGHLAGCCFAAPARLADVAIGSALLWEGACLKTLPAALLPLPEKEKTGAFTGSGQREAGSARMGDGKRAHDRHS